MPTRPFRSDSVLHLVDLSRGRLSMGRERSRGASKYSWRIYGGNICMCAGSQRRMRRERHSGIASNGGGEDIGLKMRIPPRVECVLVGGAEVRFLVQTFLSFVRPGISRIDPRASSGYPSIRNGRLFLPWTGPAEEEDLPRRTPSSTDRTSRHSILSIMRSATSLVCLILSISSRVTWDAIDLAITIIRSLGDI